MVLKEIPPNCTVVGIPGTIVKRNGKSTTQDLNQVDLPDPIAVEIECLRKRIVNLENMLRNANAEHDTSEILSEEKTERDNGEENHEDL